MGGILVQRIRSRRDSDELDIDKRFSFDYMGASEFEWGILYASLKLMRAATNVINPIKTDNSGLVMWFVGAEENREDATEFVLSQLRGDRNFNGRTFKECPGIARHIESEYPHIIGWWWLSQDGWPEKNRASLPTWCVFINEDDAKAWHECLALSSVS